MITGTQMSHKKRSKRSFGTSHAGLTLRLRTRAAITPTPIPKAQIVATKSRRGTSRMNHLGVIGGNGWISIRWASSVPTASGSARSMPDRQRLQERPGQVPLDQLTKDRAVRSKVALHIPFDPDQPLGLETPLLLDTVPDICRPQDIAARCVKRSS